MRAPTLCLLLALTGCSYTHQIGQVGPLRFHKVQIGSITAPGQTFVVIENTNTHKFEVTSPIGGNGVLSAAVLAAGGIGSSLAIADGIDRNETIRIIDDSPAPPITPPVTPPVDPKPQPPTRPPWGPPPWHKDKPKHKWD